MRIGGDGNILMHFQGLNANIMSPGSIAIAVGTMVDAAIVMIENGHKRLEEWEHQHRGETRDNGTRWPVIASASVEVGPSLFIRLLIITLVFISIFTLEGQEGCLFGPQAFTRAYAMADSAYVYRPSAFIRLRYSPGVQPNSRTKAL
ncbi:hypothetical protein BVD23_11080 [Salmonella enterica]|nr:hypothetical protein [Salmonella enterica]ECJ5918680.1 hypothetical protein [Salmonella enterica subsp. salamae]HCM1882542.1 efflux RND transporter permease subunit [Salmonella enterica subsp. salamae serovar 60:z10:z39]EAN4946267.1 hypothetical protein [Salmonella enterica]EAX8454822.1 hypothetical protein [Salmonella enterica]